jgi:hypothetical protein
MGSSKNVLRDSRLSISMFKVGKILPIGKNLVLEAHFN